MIYVKPFLSAHNKKASEFINWLEKENLKLGNFQNRAMIKINANSGSGGKIYIAVELMPILKRFLNADQ